MHRDRATPHHRLAAAQRSAVQCTRRGVVCVKEGEETGGGGRSKLIPPCVPVLFLSSRAHPLPDPHPCDCIFFLAHGGAAAERAQRRPSVFLASETSSPPLPPRGAPRSSGRAQPFLPESILPLLVFFGVFVVPSPRCHHAHTATRTHTQPPPPLNQNYTPSPRRCCLQVLAGAARVCAVAPGSVL